MSHLQISHDTKTPWPRPVCRRMNLRGGGGYICLACTSTCVDPDTRKDIFRINNTAQNTKRRPRHRGTSATDAAAAAVEVPRGDGDVLHVTRIHPRGMLIQRSGKNCSSGPMLERLPHVFDGRGVGPGRRWGGGRALGAGRSARSHSSNLGLGAGAAACKSQAGAFHGGNSS